MTPLESQGSYQVFVEFPAGAGRRQVAAQPKDPAEESARALDRSMGTIQSMANRFTAAMTALGSASPAEMELSFGIKFDSEVGAIISKVGLEASLDVKLVWKRSTDGSRAD